MSPARARVAGRGWAYTGLVLGGTVSIAANIAHSFIPPTDSPAAWAPEPGAVVSAIVWPVFLFIAIEILARTAWPAGKAWRALRWGGLLPVALLAAFVSYRHLSGLLDHYGEEPLVVVFGPLAVDGMMAMATGALIATGRRRTPTPTPTPIPAAVPAVTGGTSPAPTPTPAPVPAARPELPPTPQPATTPAVVPTPAQVAHRITPPRPAPVPAPPAPVPGPDSRLPRTRPRKPAGPPAGGLASSTTDTPVTASDVAQLSLPVVPQALLDRATRIAAEYHTEHGTPITAGQLAVRLKVTSDLAAQALTHLTTTDRPTPTVNGTPVKAHR